MSTNLVSYPVRKDVDVSIPKVVVCVVEPCQHQPTLLHLTFHLKPVIAFAIRIGR